MMRVEFYMTRYIIFVIAIRIGSLPCIFLATSHDPLVGIQYLFLEIGLLICRFCSLTEEVESSLA